jgi:hypothetical protein
MNFPPRNEIPFTHPRKDALRHYRHFFTSWERWRPAGSLRCQPADETSALPGGSQSGFVRTS